MTICLEARAELKLCDVDRQLWFKAGVSMSRCMSLSVFP